MPRLQGTAQPSGGTETYVLAACGGCLVLHRDGMVAYCTEELDGRPCIGYGARHLAGTMPCRVAPLIVQCRHCQQSLQLRLIFAVPFVPPLPVRAPALVN